MIEILTILGCAGALVLLVLTGGAMMLAFFILYDWNE